MDPNFVQLVFTFHPQRQTAIRMQAEFYDYALRLRENSVNDKITKWLALAKNAFLNTK